jgi:hypothetical protein
MNYASTTEIIYAITAQYELFEQWAMENEGDVNEEIDARIKELESMLKDRTAYYIDSIANAQDSIAGMNDRVKKLKKLIDTKEKMIERMTEKLFSITGAERAFSKVHSVSWKKSEKTIVSDEIEEKLKCGITPHSLIPYTRSTTKTTFAINKTDAKKALERGEILDGITISTTYNPIVL